MTTKSKVLVIDNDDYFKERCLRELGNRFEFVMMEVNEAWAALEDFELGKARIKEMDIIIIDCNEFLSKAIRDKGFKRPMIASSRHERFNKILMDHGCNYQSLKTEVLALLVQILNHAVLISA